MIEYDKELINSRIMEVCDYYAPGEGQREGQSRRKWQCPVCGGPNFAANSQKQCAGCFSPGCEVPRTKDAVGLIAYFEELEQRGQQFVQCLKKGYEILGIPEPDDNGGSRNAERSHSSKGEDAPMPSSGGSTDGGEASEQTGAATELKDREPESAHKVSAGGVSFAASASSLSLLQSIQNGSHEAEDMEEEGSSGELDAEQSRELVDKVYRAFVELCPLVDRDRQFWHSRGVNDDTIEKGGFGSIWREHCYEVLPELQRRFGQDELVSVPGFYLSQQGRIHTSLFDDYTLIPYYDRDGYITMVQGRVPGTPEGNKPKYVAPVNSGLHLYVFPTYKPEQVSAFVEGAVGAIVAAQSSIAVAAITGYQNYRIAGGKGEADRPLPEHARTDFDSRKIIYIPDEDVKPKTKDAVQAEAPKAARFLIESHGGTPYIARLPEGYKDLDEWLLSLDPDERIPRFAELMQNALTPEQWTGQTSAQTGDEEESGQSEDGETGAASSTDKSTNDSKKDNADAKKVHQTKEGDEGADNQDTTSQEDGPEEPGHTEHEDSSEGSSGEDEDQQTLSPGLRKREPKPRTYKSIPTTNLGEFMVSLLYGIVAGVAFFALVVFAAPEWEMTSFMARVPVAVTALVSLVIASAVLAYMCDRLYKRRWYALRNHLAGNRK